MLETGSQSVIGLVMLLALVAGIILVTTRVARAESSKVSRRLLDSLQKAPLSRVLQARQIDLREYVHSVDARLIRRQVAVCESCDSTGLCESALEAGAPAVQGFPFCANNEAIERATQAMRAARSGHRAQTVRQPSSN